MFYSSDHNEHHPTVESISVLVQYYTYDRPKRKIVFSLKYYESKTYPYLSFPSFYTQAVVEYMNDLVTSNKDPKSLQQKMKKKSLFVRLCSMCLRSD